jgi:MOSC domain-containing protein YiiM
VHAPLARHRSRSDGLRCHPGLWGTPGLRRWKSLQGISGAPTEAVGLGIVTRAIDLNALVGRRFRVGEVECVGQRLCEPCSHLEHLTTKGALRQLIHRGGLRADILTDGHITTGTVIETIDSTY